MEAPITRSEAPFQHDDLPDAAGHIRLLEVLSDNHSADIKVQCKITTWPIAEAPSYHAISYTWGDPNSNTTILINSKSVQVRTNCEFVLKQAYWFEKANYYWVDSICINQANLEEKSMQVSMMGGIFKKAAHVLACVGDHADDSAFLVKELKRRAFTKPPLRKIAHQRFSRNVRLSFGFRLRHRVSTIMRFLDAAVCFMGRPYFTRMWILQEMRNARDATFLCGSDSVPKCTIRDMTCAFFLTRDRGTFEVFRRLRAMEKYQEQLSDDFYPGPSFQSLLERAWLIAGSKPYFDRVQILMDAAFVLQCQERKDKIFGLISLIDWDSSATLVADYTLTEFQVAVTFIRALLHAWRHGVLAVYSDQMLPLCGRAVNMLHLSITSNGVPTALQARRIEPESFCSIGESSVEYTHSRHGASKGWRLSSEHLARDDSGFWIWSPPGPNGHTLHLPCWVEIGDWVLDAGSYPGSYYKYVLVRETGESFGGPLLGHAFLAGFKIESESVATAGFGIHWDPEDLVVYCLIERNLEILEKEEGIGASGEWGKALNVAVCRKPGSSYAFRCDEPFCMR